MEIEGRALVGPSAAAGGLIPAAIPECSEPEARRGSLETSARRRPRMSHGSNRSALTTAVTPARFTARVSAEPAGLLNKPCAESYRNFSVACCRVHPSRPKLRRDHRPLTLRSGLSGRGRRPRARNPSINRPPARLKTALPRSGGMKTAAGSKRPKLAHTRVCRKRRRARTLRARAALVTSPQCSKLEQLTSAAIIARWPCG